MRFPVERSGVDVIDAELDGAAQHGTTDLGIPRRSVEAAGGQPHRPEPEAEGSMGRLPSRRISRVGPARCGPAFVDSMATLLGRRSAPSGRSLRFRSP
jgi:hypothetical protein